MKEFRQGLEKKSTSSPEDMDVLRAAKKQETREDFSKEWGNTVREHQAASKISGQEIFKSLYRKRYEADPPESQPPDASPPSDPIKYLQEKLHEKQHKEIDNIHQEYEALCLKIQNKPFRTLEEIERAYKDRYKDNISITDDGTIKITTRVEGYICYKSKINIQEGNFTFVNLSKTSDQQFGPEEPSALHPIEILLFQVKDSLDRAVASGYKRENFRLNEITYLTVFNENAINASKDFIPSSGKPFTLHNVEEASRARVAFEKLMTSKFGEIVLWGARAGRDLLKYDRCNAVAITPRTPETIASEISRAKRTPEDIEHAISPALQTPKDIEHATIDSIWPYDQKTGEYTEPLQLASITFYLK